MGLFGTPSNRERQTRTTGSNMRTCRTCRGTGRARGMGASGAKCGNCRGMGVR